MLSFNTFREIKKKNRVYNYSNLQFNLKPNKFTSIAISELHKRIDSDDLYISENVSGIEINPHITIRYGLDTDDVNDVLPIFKNFGDVWVKFKKLNAFKNERFDVLHIEIESERLMELNKKVADFVNLPGETFKNYNPHCTIAYLKKNRSSKYIGKFDYFFENIEERFEKALLTNRYNETIEIDLA